MVLLKPLAKAIADNDRILAVLRGSAMNHGGHARTVTYPSSLAQSNVIAHALREAAVPVGTVSYVEAHGTGTPKGDPIEIEGLKMAFARVAAERGEVLDERTCGIGSVKTNVGHLEAVAGMAGLIKTILCMRHGVLPPLVHYRKLNPRIALDGSPFFIVDEAQPWATRITEDGQPIPRRAGISSFGFGGVNSHVVVEEYLGGNAPADAAPLSRTPACIVLSAKTASVLRERVRQLFDALASGDIGEKDLADLAYTLQVGRQAMAARLATVVDTVATLRERLERWLADDTNDGSVFIGELTAEMMASAADVPPVSPDVDLIATAQRWVHGQAFDWAALHVSGSRRRLALPTYPFVREKHWIEMKAAPGAQAAIHPLLHSNTSNVAGLRFTSRFTGRESFLADHVVLARRTLPAAAQLEMVRCAAELAFATAGSCRVENVVWLRPFVTGEEPRECHVALFPEGEGRFAFEIYDDIDDGTVYSQGVVVKRASDPDAVTHDLASIRAHCGRPRRDANAYYALFERMGLAYGPAHRSLGEFFVGEAEALARIVLPETSKSSQGDYRLHPSVLDAALQAAIACLVEQDPDAGLALPFALASLDIMAPCNADLWAVIRREPGHSPGDALNRFEIDLCSDAGAVCARLGGFCLRAVNPAHEETTRTALLVPAWHPRSAMIGAGGHAQHVVMLCAGAPSADLQLRLHGVTCIDIDEDDDTARRYESAAALLLENIQAMVRQPGRHLIQIVVPQTGDGRLMGGLGGLLLTAQRENPRVVGQVIELEAGQDIAQAIIENRDSLASRIRYVGGVRQEGHWTEATPPSTTSSPWKAGGTYLITGGAGGLGRILARRIAAEAKGATLVLTGRSPSTDALEASFADIVAAGATVRYRQLDVGDGAAVNRLVRQLAAATGSLHGIVHAAGVLRDSLLVRKTRDELREVLRAKVAGTLHLDAASRDLDLDVFICFASTSGALGNVGQADYAAANAFMDAFARQRVERVAQGLRRGRTLSVDWPLWAEGGMRVNEATRAEMIAQTGLVPLRTVSGLAALEQALALDVPQVLVAEGAIARFMAGLAHVPAAPLATAGSATAGEAGMLSDELRDKAVRYFGRLLAGTLKRPAESIDAKARLEAYGIDSILVMELTRSLEQVFGPLSKTLLFEYQTIADVAGHFLDEHRDRLSKVLGENVQDAAVTVAPRHAAEPVQAPASLRPRFGTEQGTRGDVARVVPDASANTVGEIAIIGVAGRYPQAADLEA
ncbi:MAG: type I polyketide synthase, partial [Pseudomonadota bacterium]